MLLLQGRRPVHDRAPLAVDGGSGLGADAIAPGLQPASRRGYAAAPGEGGRPVEPAVPVTNKQAGKRLCIRDLRTEAQNRPGLSAGQEVLARFPGSARRRIHVEEVLSQPERNRRKRSLDEKLDEALQQTFPASDAFAFALGF